MRTSTQDLMEKADAQLGQMDSSLGKATERLGVLIAKSAGNRELQDLAKAAQQHVSMAHDRLGAAGKALGQAAIAARGSQTTDPPEPAPNDTGPSYPPGTKVVEPTQGINGGWDLGTVAVNGGLAGTKGFKDRWFYFRADADGDAASMSADGGYVAIAVADQPTDPRPASKPWGSGNAAEVRPYKAGQFVSFAVGEGGHQDYRAALFGVHKYA